jgi:PHD/YefM family antitoxin component YafN of YafNO toxin-antitoxin module
MGRAAGGYHNGAASRVDVSWAMQAVSISGLKHNPAEAVRQAKSGPVVVLNRDNPDAIRLTAAETHADLDTLKQWLASSSPTPAPPIPVAKSFASCCTPLSAP